MIGRRAGLAAAGLALVAALSGCSVLDSVLPDDGAGNVPLSYTGFVESGGNDFTAPVDGADGTAGTPAGAGAAAILGSATVLDVVGIDGVTLSGGGTGVNTPDAAALAALQITHDAGKLGQLLVSNYDDAAGDFSPETAATLLGDQANIDAVATSLAGFVTEQGWDAVMIDLESMTDAQVDGVTSFATALRTAVGPDVRLDIAVQAATDAAGYRSLGYDLGALAGIVDHVTVMAYDQHGPFDLTQPGAVGALDWQRQVVDAALEAVPAEKLDLGVAQYGYVFGPEAGETVSPAEARERVAEAGVEATFDADAAEWTATLSEGTVIWWADLDSLTYRLELARTSGLHGISIWSLNLADPLAP